MSVQTVVTCDAVHPERTPPRCRAYLPVPDRVNPDEVSVLLYAQAMGWKVTVANPLRTTCPSCSRGRSS